MKNYLLLIIVIMISLNEYSFAGIRDSQNDQKVRLDQLKNEVLLNLTHNLLPYWSTRMVDTKNGGFYGRINVKDKVFPDEDKGGILNARILWNFHPRLASYTRHVDRGKDTER